MTKHKRKCDSKELSLILNNNNKKNVIFGVGNALLKYLPFFIKNSVCIDYCIDNSVIKQGKAIKDVNSKVYGSYGNLTVISPDELLRIESVDNLRVLITSNHIDEMKSQLLSLGVKECINCYEYLWHGYDYDSEELEKINTVYSLLADDDSKKAFESYLAGVITVDGKKFKEACKFSNGRPYVCPDFFTFTDNEVFVDCGAYTGDTIQSFLEATQGKYKKIIAFEPNKPTFNILKNNLIGYDNMVLHNCGVSDSVSTFTVDTCAGAYDQGANLIPTVDNITDLGDDVVFSETLDKVCEGDNITYIKMDVEGFEKQALLGAKEIIRKYKPKLAISAYHKKEDIYELALLIKELNPNYKLHFRSYYSAHYDGIIYAE